MIKVEGFGLEVEPFYRKVERVYLIRKSMRNGEYFVAKVEPFPVMWNDTHEM